MVYSEDFALADAVFEIEISSTVVEEQDWANTTYVKVKFNKSSCQVSKSDIDKVAGTIPEIHLSATKYLSRNTFNITDLI